VLTHYTTLALNITSITLRTSTPQRIFPVTQLTIIASLYCSGIFTSHLCPSWAVWLVTTIQSGFSYNSPKRFRSLRNKTYAFSLCCSVSLYKAHSICIDIPCCCYPSLYIISCQVEGFRLTPCRTTISFTRLPKFSMFLLSFCLTRKLKIYATGG
jgi:hypothetical protein